MKNRQDNLYTRQDIEILAAANASLLTGSWFVDTPPNRFRKGRVTIVLQWFRWWQLWRLVSVWSLQKKLTELLPEEVTVMWDIRKTF